MKTISKERADELDAAWHAATDLQRLSMPRLEWFSAGDGDVKYWEAQPTKLEMVAAARIAELEAALRSLVADCDDYARINNLSGTWATIERARKTLG